MISIVVGSLNPVKVAAVKAGFEALFPHETITINGVKAASGVNDQPMGNDETYRGADNRAKHAAELSPTADFAVGIEGGIMETEHGMEAFAWVIIRHKAGLIGKGKTGTFLVPPAVAALIKQGKELAEADSEVFGRENAKRTNGTIGFLTNDVIDRTRYYTHAVILALVPFVHEKWYRTSL